MANTTIPDSTRNAISDAVAALVDAGAGPGALVYVAAGDVEVATLTFSDPAFGASAAGVATANAITSDSDATGGDVVAGILQDSDANEVIRGDASAAGGGGAFEITGGTLIPAGVTVSCSSLTITTPSSVSV